MSPTSPLPKDERLPITILILSTLVGGLLDGIPGLFADFFTGALIIVTVQYASESVRSYRKVE